MIACLQLANTVVGMLAGELPDQALLDEMLSQLELQPDALDVPRRERKLTHPRLRFQRPR